MYAVGVYRIDEGETLSFFFVQTVYKLNRSNWNPTIAIQWEIKSHTKSRLAMVINYVKPKQYTGKSELNRYPLPLFDAGYK